MHSSPFFLLFLFGFSFAVSIPPQTNNQVSIGVLTEPVFPDDAKFGSQYLAASYIKWVEGGGAQGVPVDVEYFAKNLTALFDLWNRLNGFLSPGGGVELSTQPNFMFVMEHLMKWSEQAFDQLALEQKYAPKKIPYAVPHGLEEQYISNPKRYGIKGDYIPMWFTCMSFQAVLIGTANNNFSVLQGGFDSENLALPLDFTAENYKRSRLFSIPPESFENLIHIISTEPVTMNNHQGGVTPETFSSNPILPLIWNPISTNKDRKGREFLSTVEHLKYPFYASQWHPEKPIYEWPNPVDENIPHNRDTVFTSNAFSFFFVSEARRSIHTMTHNELASLVIYNYPVTYTGEPHGSSTSFRQTYFFK